MVYMSSIACTLKSSKCFNNILGIQATRYLSKEVKAHDIMKVEHCVKFQVLFLKVKVSLQCKNEYIAKEDSVGRQFTIEWSLTGPQVSCVKWPSM
jgi:hypothetical protein